MNIHIENEQLRAIEAWFESYTGSFSHDNAEIRLNLGIKKAHSLRVRSEIRDLGKALGLKDDALRMAELIGLLHDCGRFAQYVRYGTFKDSRSTDHAELGIEVLKEHRVLDGIGGTERTLIFRAIVWHNKIRLPQGEGEPFLFYEKLIRDADKLDIWKVVLDYYYRRGEDRNNAIELDLPDTPGYSETVMADLRQKTIVNIGHIQNMNDFKLLQMGWIYDINFLPTLQKIAEREYLQRIRAVLPPSGAIDEILAMMLKHCNGEKQE